MPGALTVKYNTANQLVATRTYSSNSNSELQLVPLAFNYFCYNSLGQRTLAVEDMNSNGQIDWKKPTALVAVALRAGRVRSVFI